MSETTRCPHDADGPCSFFCAALARHAGASPTADAPPEKAAEAPAAEAPPAAPPASPAPPAISDELRAVLARADAFEAEEKEKQKLARREWHHTVLNGRGKP
jgi:hypothetical protein